MERLHKNQVIKTILWILFACSLALNILLGYVSYKYFILYKESKSSSRETVNEEVPLDIDSSVHNPFQNSNGQLKVSGGEIQIIDANGVVKNTVSISLSDKEVIGDVSMSNENDKLAVIAIQNSNSDWVLTRLLVMNISDNKVLKQLQTNDTYEYSGKATVFQIFQSSIWSNDDKLLYVSYSAGGSGEKTLGIDTNTYGVSVDDCYGGIIGVMPAKDSIQNMYYSQYADDLLLISHHYFVIGGGSYEINIVNSKTCKTEDENILEYSDNINADLETFYNILNINMEY